MAEMLLTIAPGGVKSKTTSLTDTFSVLPFFGVPTGVQRVLHWICGTGPVFRFRLAAITLEPLEFIRRFLQHVLPRGFARVRTFGWLHPAAKVRGNRVRALLRQQPVLTTAEKHTWEPSLDPPE